MRQLILIIVVLVSCPNYGQILRNYLDLPGKFIRSNEEKRARQLKEETVETALRYIPMEATTLIEQNSKTKNTMKPYNSAFINYGEYKNICNSYFNPFKKEKCTNRYNYLINAHKKVLEFAVITPKNKINKGINEQIGEKYTRITNMIFLELEKLKRKAEKDNYYKLLFIK